MSENPVLKFEKEKQEAIKTYAQDLEWQALSSKWLDKAFRQKYMYNFTALGRPIIQLPADIVAFQEVIWSVRPDLIIETGIAHGGSLILSASMLALLDYCDAAIAGKPCDPKKSSRQVLGIDIDIRSHNRKEIQEHPLSGMIKMIEGSSVAIETIKKVREISKNYSKILVCLDSNHTHDHVLQELNLYAPLVTKGSYCIVFDTIVEDLPNDLFPDRPWSQGNNPKTAVHSYLESLNTKKSADMGDQTIKFEIDKSIEEKLLLSVAADGYLKRL